MCQNTRCLCKIDKPHASCLSTALVVVLLVSRAAINTTPPSHCGRLLACQLRHRLRRILHRRRLRNKSPRTRSLQLRVVQLTRTSWSLNICINGAIRTPSVHFGMPWACPALLQRTTLQLPNQLNQQCRTPNSASIWFRSGKRETNQAKMPL